METELYKKYRPTKFEDVIGQEEAVKMLKGMIANKRVPHTLLFTGGSGCGKTTLARIMRLQLKCGNSDFTEVNCADFRGIDMVRDIRTRMQFSPMSGKCLIWSIDECFSGDSLIDTPEGRKRIDSISQGDKIYNINGETTVVHHFKNTVNLNRVTKITFDDGRIIFTTVDHKFLTDSGWVSAGSLKHSDCIFGKIGYSTLMEKSNYERVFDLHFLSGKVSNKVEKPSRMLFKIVCPEKKTGVIRKWKNCRENLSTVQNRIQSGEKFQPEEMLQYVLCKKRTDEKSTVPFKNFQFQSEGEDQQITYRNEKTVVICHDERKKSYEYKKYCRESSENERKKWDAAYLERKAWRKWTTNGASKTIAREFGDSMETRGVYKNQKEKSISSQIHSGYRKSMEEDSHRNRWEESRNEKTFIARCKEDKGFRITRVASIEIYQQGCNDESFLGIIRDQERSQGWINFYDLQVSGHPSYFVNGIPVHNCHKLTNDAQNAFLKILEDTPKHVYFMLCTTDPNKLLKTIHTRCTEIKTTLVEPGDMRELLIRVLKKENGKLSDEIIDRLIEVAEGSPRKALVLLNQILHIEGEEEQLNCIQSSDSKAQAIQIARLLVDPKTKWPEISKVLREVEDEPESIRHMVLGYANALMLSNKFTAKAYLIICAFEGNFYDSKKAGLIRACYEVISSK